MHSKDLYRSLRLLLECDRDLGLGFLARSAAGSQAAAATASPAARPAPPLGPPPLPAITGVDAGERLAQVATLVSACSRCPLSRSRTHAVPGEGDPMARILFIGEAPGADEDRQGRPFVGRAGELLDKMIVGMGLTRDRVFITNTIKCRPPGNRTPEETEAAACRPYLEVQLETIAPAVVCTLGNTPLKALKPDAAGITREHGRRFLYRDIPVIPTYHPSYLLRNEAAKKPCWNDLKLVLAEIGLKPPGR